MICVMSQDAETGQQRKASTQQDLRALASKSLTLAASVIRILTVIFAAILVIHVVLTVASANPQNGITTFFADAANNLTLGIGDLFLPAISSACSAITLDTAIVRRARSLASGGKWSST